jgi:hypothetical protein
MVKLAIPGRAEPLYMDGYLYNNLTIGRDIIKKDWDLIFLVDGAERSGKSALAQQCAVIFDPDITINQICFTPQEFRKCVLDAKPYTVVIYDEAYTGLTSRGTMSVINRTLVSLLAEIGQRNLIIFVVMPTYFDLDKYVALWRSRALLHVYTGENFERGYFAFYNVDNKKTLYIDGKKYYDYKRVKPNFYGRFPNGYMVPDDQYRQKKRDSLSGRAKEQEAAELKREIEGALLERVLALGDKVTHKVKMEMLGMTPATYYRRLSDYRNSDKGDQEAAEEINPEHSDQNPQNESIE